MFGVLRVSLGGCKLSFGVLPITLGKDPGRGGGGGEGEGEMGACLIDGVSSDTFLVWAAVSIGVAKWTQERLR